MRIDTLSIRGVLAFGETVSLAFRELPSGLIALVGRIGSGKTTLLEAPIAALYRQFPSRERKEPFDYATGPDAFLETVFELEGRGLYRARLNLDGPHRRQEAVLVRREADGRELFVATTQSLASYDAAIAELLPSLDQLLASVLAVQTRRGSFSERDRKSRREVLQSFLGLDGLEVKAGWARQAIARVTQQIDTLTITRDALAREAGDVTEDTLEQRAQALQVRAGHAELRRDEVRQQIVAAEDALQAITADAHTYAAAAERFRRHDQDVADRTRDRDAVQTALDRHRREGQAERRRVVERHTAWLQRNDAEQHDTSAYEADVAEAARRRDATIRDLTQKIASNKALIERAGAIRAAAARAADLGALIAKETEAAKAAMLQREAAQSADAITRASLADLDAKATALRRAEADARLLTAVPCHGDPDYAACQFLTNAQRAKAQIGPLTDAVAGRGVLEQELRAIGDRLREAIDRYTAATDAIDALTTERTTLAAAAAELTDLARAEDRIKLRTQQIADARAQYERERQAAMLRAAAIVERLQIERGRRDEEHAGALVVFDENGATREDELEDQIDQLTTVIAEARFALDQEAEVMARTADAAAREAEQQAALAVYRREWDVIIAAIATIAADVRDLDQQRAQFARRQMRLAALDTQREGLRVDLVEWQALAKAYAREGLPTLEIDAMGPRVTQLVNQLLLAGYGSRFTGDLVTQVARASRGRDGATHKDTVEFKVYDHAKGGAERDLWDLSGGQKIVIEEALRSAIALYVNERQPTPMRTCWRDETTGSLDPESAVAYMGMLRKVYELGHFHQLIFVTHTPECSRLADAQVVFTEEGTFDVQFPPFGLTAFVDDEAQVA